MILSIIIFLFVLNTLVIFHEFGHYLSAEKVNVEVKEFAIGMGPAIFKRKIGKTLFRVNIIPIGGYNSLKGELDSEEGEGNLVNASKKERFLVLFSGSFMNFLLAALCFIMILLFNKNSIEVYTEMKPLGATIEYINKGAYIYGYIKGSDFANLDGSYFPIYVREVENIKIINNEHLIETLKQLKKEGLTTVSFKLEKARNLGETFDLRAKFVDDYKVGIELGQDTNIFWRYNNFLLGGGFHMINVLRMQWYEMGNLVRYIVKTKDYSVVGYTVSGPVALYKVVDTMRDYNKGIYTFVDLTGQMSLMLGIFNLLPIPSLDGWHILLLGVEKLKGRKLNGNKVSKVTVIGFIMLLAFSLLITIKDIIIFIVK